MSWVSWIATAADWIWWYTSGDREFTRAASKGTSWWVGTVGRPLCPRAGSSEETAKWCLFALVALSKSSLTRPNHFRDCWLFRVSCTSHTSNQTTSSCGGTLDINHQGMPIDGLCWRSCWVGVVPFSCQADRCRKQGSTRSCYSAQVMSRL